MENQGFHDVHCPHCGKVFSAQEIYLSLADFMMAVDANRNEFEDAMGTKSLDSEFKSITGGIAKNLWYYSPSDIVALKKIQKKGDTLEFSGKDLIRKFKLRPEESQLFDDLKAGCIVNGRVDMSMIDESELKQLREVIRRGMPYNIYRKIGDVSTIDALIEYALSGRTLLRCDIKCEDEPDDRGNYVVKSFTEKHVNCSAKQKYCPYCGGKLSSMAGLREEKIVCFLGTPAAGKSAYMTSAVATLLDGTEMKDISVRISGEDERSDDYKIFMRENYYPFLGGFAPKKTNVDDFPQLTIEVAYKDKEYLYTLVDIPGESFLTESDDFGALELDETTLKMKRNIIASADVILFCVSANQMFDLDIDIDSGQQIFADLNSIGTRMRTVINTMFNGGEIPAAALLLTKSDMLTDKFEEMYLRTSDESVKLEILDVFNYVCKPPKRSGNNAELISAVNENHAEALPVERNVKSASGREPIAYNYNKFKVISKACYDCFKNHGCDDARKFLKEITERIFKFERLATFSTAPLGVSVPAFDNKFLGELKDNDPELQKKIDHTIQRFGQTTLEDIIGTQGQIGLKQLQAIHKAFALKRNRETFNVLAPMMWIFAYTGLIDVCEIGMDNSPVVMDRRNNEEEIKRILSLRPAAQANDSEPEPELEPEPVKRTFWDRLLGRK